MTARMELRRLGAVVLVLAAIAGIGFGLSRVRLDTGIASFVPSGDASYDQLKERDTDFGSDPIVVLLSGKSQNGIFLDSDQLTKLVVLEGVLAALPDVAVVYGPGTVLNQTAGSVKNVILQMSGRRDALENTARAQGQSQKLGAAATERLVSQTLAGFDRRYGALIAKAMPMGLPTLSNQKFVASVLFGEGGEPRPEWKFLVPTATSATLLVRPREGLDQAHTKTLVDRVNKAIKGSGLDTSRPVITGVPVLTSAVSQSASSEAPRIGAIALAAVGLVFFLLPWSKRRRDRLRPLAPALLGTVTTVAIFGLLDKPLSLGAVAFLPIVLGIGSDFPLYLSQPSQRRRVLVAAGAAVLAFAALAISPIPFVREFGVALALAVVATVGWALVLRSRAAVIEPAAEDSPARALGGRAKIAALLLASTAAVAGWSLLPSLEVQSSPEELAKGLPELADVTRAEQTLGFSGELSLVVRGKNVLSPEMLAWSEKVESQIITEHGDQLRPLLTVGRLLDFLGEGATQEQVTAGSSLLPPYLLNAVVSGDGDVASSEFGVRLKDLSAQRDLIEDIRSDLPPPPSGYRVEVVGLPVVATSSLDALSASRYSMTLLGVVVAALVVGLALRSRRTSALVVASTLLSSGWVFLAIKLAGIDLTPLTLAVGALITVTSAEFTVMLASSSAQGQGWLRRSVAVAASAGTAGYLCLSFSELAVLRDFGLALAGGVASTYLAARLVTTLWSTRTPETASTEAVQKISDSTGAPRQKELV